jgi:hypothetical protein
MPPCSICHMGQTCTMHCRRIWDGLAISDCRMLKFRFTYRIVVQVYRLSKKAWSDGDSMLDWQVIPYAYGLPAFDDKTNESEMFDRTRWGMHWRPGLKKPMKTGQFLWKSDKTGLVQFCWLTENRSIEFEHFKNLRIFEIKILKKLDVILRILVKIEF